MATRILSGLLIIYMVCILISCRDSVITGETEVEGIPEEVSFAFVKMPYPSPYGPKVVEDIYSGSIDRFNPDSKEPPPPSSFGCFLSWANPKKSPKYLWYNSYIFVSNSLIEHARNTYKQVEIQALSSEAPNGKTMGVARCLVPSSPNIEMIVERHFKRFANRSEPEMEINYEVSSIIVDSTLMNSLN